MAVDGDVVAGGQLVGGGLLYQQVRVLYLGQGDPGVVGQPADVVTSVVVVVAVAPEPASHEHNKG